jgi:hypothetical protein
MKNMKIILNSIAFLLCISSYAQSNCSSFYPTQQGQKHVIHQLDKRENLDLILEHTVLQATPSELTMLASVKDKRGRDIVENSFKATCSGGITRLDPASIMSAQLQQYDGMEYSITGDDIFFPNTLTVGQSLPDATVTMKVDAGMMNITTKITMTDRKVERQEAITTPAGTFDCYLITYSNNLKMGALNKTYSCKQWIAQGVGMVQEETRKRNGNLMTKSILHSIN